MPSWMRDLARHYDATRAAHPDDNLMILFDIDGTILDMRHLICYVLRRYDRVHGTSFFRRLRIEDIDVHENHVESLLERLEVPARQRAHVWQWFRSHAWSMAPVLEAHRPFAGVLEVIRWFQMQPNTYVGVNTGRPEALRDETLLCLNELGHEYHVSFSDELLHMRRDPSQEVLAAKQEGIRYFQAMGFRIFAAVDNEPEVLEAIAAIDPQREILLLHAETLFETRRESLPARTVAGAEYDLTELIPERALPRHIQFVWHGVNDPENLELFLNSDVHWAELDVRFDPTFTHPILRHDSFKETPLRPEEAWLELDDVLAELKRKGRGAKLDLKGGGELVDMALELTRKHGFGDDELWFNGNIERIQERGFRRFQHAHPDAIRQCPVDFLAPLILTGPQKAKDILDMLFTWGINRFSVSWLTIDVRKIANQLARWGFEVNIYNVPDLEAFLQAALLTPRSITSDFNFPKWSYYGRGSGEGGNHHSYEMQA